MELKNNLDINLYYYYYNNIIIVLFINHSYGRVLSMKLRFDNIGESMKLDPLKKICDTFNIEGGKSYSCRT